MTMLKKGWYVGRNEMVSSFIVIFTNIAVDFVIKDHPAACMLLCGAQ